MRVLVDLLEHILYEPLYDQVRQLQRIVRTKSDSANTKYTTLQSASICLYYIYISNLASTSICSHSLEHSYGRKNNLVTRFLVGPDLQHRSSV